MFEEVKSEDIFLDPIGTTYKITDTKQNETINGIFEEKIELYCPFCKKERVFSGSFIKLIDHIYDARNFCLKKSSYNDLVCKKYQCEYRHIVNVVFEVTNDKHLKKIGQSVEPTKLNPSIKNELIGELEDMKEFYYNALKARNNNLNIAAFNYLRRIFEKLILDAEKNYDGDISSEKVKEKINILVDNNLLNDILKEQGFNVLYTLISDGVHNLSEEECKEQFDLLHDAIITILEDELHKKKKEKRRKSIAKKLSNQNSKEKNN